jgi:hypothetical protein
MAVIHLACEDEAFQLFCEVVELGHATQSLTVDLVADFTLRFLRGNDKVFFLVPMICFVYHIDIPIVEFYRCFDAQSQRRTSRGELEWFHQPSNFQEMSLDVTNDVFKFQEQKKENQEWPV